MRCSLSFRFLFGTWLALAFPQLAHGQAALSAREHYAQGLALVNSGDVAGAAREFEMAYRISPNDMVLYNLGQAYLQLGNPAAALQAFEGYLRGVPSLKADRQAEVSSLIAICKRRVGSLSLSVLPSGSEIVIDGQSLGRSPMAKPIALSAGRHGLTVEGSGLRPFIGRVDIEPEKEATLAVRLEPAVPVSTAPKLGWLALNCDVPAVQVLVDGEPVAADALDFLLVGVGRHRVSWARTGYDTSEVQVSVSEEQPAHGECDLRPRAGLAAQDTGTLSLSINTSGSEIRIDGRAAPARLRLPRGPHHVSIRRSGYLDWSQTVNLDVGFPNVVHVELRPNAERTAALERTNRTKRWAYAVAGAGLALLGGGAALYAQNGRRYGRWQNERDALSVAFQNGADASTLSQRSSTLREEAVSIQRRDDLVLGVGVLGVGLLSYAVVSWLTAEP